MLYPKEDKEDKQLLMACKMCEHFEEARSNTTYCINYEKRRVKNNVLPVDIVTDPTLPHIRENCPKCSNEEAVLYYGDEVDEEIAFVVYYACTACHNIWSLDS